MLSTHTSRLYSCPRCGKNHFKKIGYFYRKVSKTYIPRYLCHECGRTFSTRTLSPSFAQKRPDLNRSIFSYLTSGVTMRQTARKLGCDQKTVYRRFLWLAAQARLAHAEKTFTIKSLEFDEMESIEHTKLKPLTIALAVSDQYEILGVKVGTLPAKGRLAEISRKKYGPRPSQSDQKVRELLQGLKITSEFSVKSDAKPSYAPIVKECFPGVHYQQFNAGENKEKRRELKHTSLEKKIFDPLFAVNQRMAKLRDHIKRLTRRSWCTTKIIGNLEAHIYLYIAANNCYHIV